MDTLGDLRRRSVRITIAIALGLACHRSKEVTPGSLATRSDSALAPPPASHLPIPPLDNLPWDPASLVAGDPAALATALAEHPRWALELSPALLRRGDDEPLRDALTHLAQSPTRGAQTSAGPVITITTADDGPELPDRADRADRAHGARRADRAGRAFAAPLPLERSTSPLGRPRYSHAAVTLDPEWRESRTLPTIVITTPDLPRATWSSLQAFAVGTCDPALDALAAGQERSLALLSPFFDHLDNLLTGEFRRRLGPALPGLTKALAEASAATTGSASTEADRCRRAYAAYLATYTACAAAEPPCPAAPRIFAGDGAMIALPEPDVGAIDRCAELLGVDPPRTIRGLALASSRQVIATLDPAWSALAARFGLLGEVYDALRDLCAPRRRRLDPGAVATARRKLGAIAAALAAPPSSPARWTVAEEASLARATTTTSSSSDKRGALPLAWLRDPQGPQIAQEARGLRSHTLQSSRCAADHDDPPLAIVTVDPRRGVTFLGFFYREELVCGDLPPLLGDGGPAGPFGAAPRGP